jgi:antitoxin component of MazEF toxin-antitoxin module
MDGLIERSGKSLVVRIPAAVAREHGLADGVRVDLQVTDRQIILGKARARRPMKELLKHINPAAYRRRSKELG